jgi:hypothetical protein
LSKGVFGVVAREVHGIEFDAEMFLLGHAWEMQCMQPAITVRGPRLLIDILSFAQDRYDNSLIPQKIINTLFCFVLFSWDFGCLFFLDIIK